MTDFFTTNRENLAAIAQALDALEGMRGEFEQRGSADEHWFYHCTCDVVWQDYELHELLARLEGEKTRWSARLEARLLAQHTLATIDRIAAMLNRTLEKRVAALTNNPKISDPIHQCAREFSTFRRLNEKSIRALRRQLGEEAGQERPSPLQDVDHQIVAGLALEIIRWLSQFGRAATLLISAIRALHAQGQPPPEASPPAAS